MNEQLARIMKQRGKVVALLVICGTAVALVHKEAAAAIFAAVAVPVGALAAMEAWVAKGSS